MIPAYLDPERLTPRMGRLPGVPFLVRRQDWTIIDGDTLRIRTSSDAQGRRHEAFRVRLHGIDAPELRKPALFDPVLAVAGADFLKDGPGEVARDHFRRLCAGRAILVSPVHDPYGRASRDHYGRLLANLCVSGARGDLFQLEGAFSAERALLDAGMVRRMGDSTIPALQPSILFQIQDSIEAMAGPSMPGPRGDGFPDVSP